LVDIARGPLEGLRYEQPIALRSATGRRHRKFSERQQTTAAMQRPLRDHLVLEARLTFETGAVFTCRPTQNSVSSNIHFIPAPEIIFVFRHL
jgi:hypothetical protein